MHLNRFDWQSKIFVCVCACIQVQTGGSVSSMEGFSPGSHTGELTPQAAAQEEEEKERRGGGDKEHLIPWVLIPITGQTL